MKQPVRANYSAGFEDLRQQIAALVCNTPLAADQMGTLPISQTQPAQRATLHLKAHTKEKSAEPAV